MLILTKLFSTILLFGLFCALSSETFADIRVVTSGYAFGGGFGGAPAYFHFSGSD